MSDCTLSNVVDAVGNLGVPITLLLFVVYGVYLTFGWLAPRIDKWVDSYLEMQQHKADLMEKASGHCAKLQTANLMALRDLIHTIEKLEAHCNALNSRPD